MFFFGLHSVFSQAVQEEVSIPGAFAKLNYLSTRAAGYLSMLRILLTPPTPLSPVSPLGGLSKVHVRASVEGRLYQRWYPAGPGLVHRLVWNKTDVYGQEVWGLTHATGEYNVEFSNTMGLILNRFISRWIIGEHLESPCGLIFAKNSSWNAHGSPAVRSLVLFSHSSILLVDTMPVRKIKTTWVIQVYLNAQMTKYLWMRSNQEVKWTASEEDAVGVPLGLCRQGLKWEIKSKNGICSAGR